VSCRAFIIASGCGSFFSGPAKGFNVVPLEMAGWVAGTEAGCDAGCD
jgi:hypothetical protein